MGDDHDAHANPEGLSNLNPMRSPTYRRIAREASDRFHAEVDLPPIDWAASDAARADGDGRVERVGGGPGKG